MTWYNYRCIRYWWREKKNKEKKGSYYFSDWKNAKYAKTDASIFVTTAQDVKPLLGRIWQLCKRVFIVVNETIISRNKSWHSRNCRSRRENTTSAIFISWQVFIFVLYHNFEKGRRLRGKHKLIFENHNSCCTFCMTLAKWFPNKNHEKHQINKWRITYCNQLAILHPI